MSDDSQLEQVSSSDWNKPTTSAYGKILSNMLRDRTATATYRQSAYDTIAAQTRAAETGIKDASIQAYGVNNPSGQTGALIGQQRAKAPYASADIAAKEMGRQSALSTGQAILNKKQSQANWYSTMIAPWLQEQELKSGMALGLAQIASQGQISKDANSTAKDVAWINLLGGLL